MALYGDFDAVFGDSIQPLGFGRPTDEIDQFHGVITATPITGQRNRGQEQTINRGAFQRPGKPGKWSDIISVSYHMDVHRLAKLWASMIGSVTTSVLTADKSWKHELDPSVSSSDQRFHTLHFNRNGRVYTHFDAESLQWSLAQGDEFWDCTMTIGARWIAHCQAFPTTLTADTYNGLVIAFGQYLFGDTADTTYEFQIALGGTFGTATVETRKQGDASWSQPQTINSGIPISVRDENEVDSGMLIVFLPGAAEVHMIDYAQGALDTVSVTYAGGAPVALTEGTEFAAVTDNATTAQNIAEAINDHATLASQVYAKYRNIPNRGSTYSDLLTVEARDGSSTVVLATGDAAAWDVDTTANGNLFDLAGPDDWSFNSRGVVIASTVPDHTVFSPNSFEVKELKYDGVDFEIEPNTLGLGYTRGLKQDDYVVGTPYVRGYPRTTFNTVTGSFRARSASARYIQDSNNNLDRSFKIAMEGQLIGTSLDREKISFEVPQLKVDPGVMEELSQDYVNYHDVSFKGHPSTDTETDAFQIVIQSDEERLDQ